MRAAAHGNRGALCGLVLPLMMALCEPTCDIQQQPLVDTGDAVMESAAHENGTPPLAGRTLRRSTTCRALHELLDSSSTGDTNNVPEITDAHDGGHQDTGPRNTSTASTHADDEHACATATGEQTPSMHAGPSVSVAIQTEPRYSVLPDRDASDACREIKRAMHTCKAALHKWALPEKVDAYTQTSDPITLYIEIQETRAEAIEREASYLRGIYDNRNIAESLTLIAKMLNEWPSSRQLYNVRVYQPGELPTDAVRVELCRSTNMKRKKNFKTRHVYTYPITAHEHLVEITDFEAAEDARGPFLACATAIFDNPMSATHSLFVEIARVVCHSVQKTLPAQSMHAGHKDSPRGRSKVVTGITYKICVRRALVCNATLEHNFMPIEYKRALRDTKHSPPNGSH